MLGIELLSIVIVAATAIARHETLRVITVAEAAAGSVVVYQSTTWKHQTCLIYSKLRYQNYSFFVYLSGEPCV
jgi:hypothetical protein